MNDHVETLWNWNLFGLDIPITNVVLMSWITMAVIILWALLATRKLKLIPKGLQNTAEIVVETLNNFSENMIGKDGRKYAAYLGTVRIVFGNCKYNRCFIYDTNNKWSYLSANKNNGRASSFSYYDYSNSDRFRN